MRAGISLLLLLPLGHKTEHGEGLGSSPGCLCAPTERLLGIQMRLRGDLLERHRARFELGHERALRSRQQQALMKDGPGPGSFELSPPSTAVAVAGLRGTY